MPAARPRARLRLDRLEDRAVPALFGQPWANAATLSVSYAPDGTDVAGAKSNLTATLDARMPNATWKGEVARALQTWAAESNVNFRFAPDFGSPFGADLAFQGSAWVGDIRLAARPLSGNVLAVTNPPDPVSAWSGELVLNSSQAFSVGGGGGTYDLYTVLLQEVGHALGVGNCADPESAMFETYQGERDGLSDCDVAAVQALYGARDADRFEGAKNNDALSRAAVVTYISSSSQLGGTDGTAGSAPLVAAADLRSDADTDWFAVALPAGVTSATVGLRASLSSLLEAKVSLHDAAGANLASAVATAPGQDLTLTATGLTAGQTYFVRVRGAADDASGVGAYRLAVGASTGVVQGGTLSTWFSTANGTVTHTEPSTGEDANATIGTAVALGKTRPTTDGRWDVFGLSTFRNAADVDFYQVNTRSDAPPVMMAAVWSNGLLTADPEVTVYNADGVALPRTQLRNDGTTHIVQVEGIKPNKAYYVAVRAAKFPSFTLGAPQYWFALDSRPTTVSMSALASGALTASQSVSAASLTVERSQLFRFELSAASTQAATATFDILDDDGTVVRSVTAAAGETRTVDAFLAAGTYTVRVSATAPATVTLRFLALTDPIGPTLVGPVSTSGTSGSGDTSRTGDTSDSGDPGYYWSLLLLSDPLGWTW